MNKIIPQERIGYTELLQLIDNGRFQESTAKWYLELIETEVTQYVKEKGVDINYIGHDYNTKPKDINIMKKNTEILESILNINNDEVLKQELINPLINKIYPVIDSILLTFKYILLNQYNIPIQQELSLTLIENNSFGQKIIGDYLYLYSLKDESKIEISKSSKTRDVNVVTFIGLIYNCLIRMCYECKSCYKHWSK